MGLSAMIFLMKCDDGQIAERERINIRQEVNITVGLPRHFRRTIMTIKVSIWQK